MATAEVRIFDETRSELVVSCSPEEFEALSTKSSELTGRHYRDGASRELCDKEWAQFVLYTLGWSLIQQIESAERSGIQTRLTSDQPVPHK